MLQQLQLMRGVRVHLARVSFARRAAGSCRRPCTAAALEPGPHCCACSNCGRQAQHGVQVLLMPSTGLLPTALCRTDAALNEASPIACKLISLRPVALLCQHLCECCLQACTQYLTDVSKLLAHSKQAQAGSGQVHISSVHKQAVTWTCMCSQWLCCCLCSKLHVIQSRDDLRQHLGCSPALTGLPSAARLEKVLQDGRHVGVESHRALHIAGV